MNSLKIMYRQKFEYFLNASLCLDFGGGWRANLSFGATNQYSGWYARMAFRGLKIGYGETYYREQYIASYKELPSGETINTGYSLGEQTVGTITVQIDGWQLRVSNDCLGDGHDRWRTSAVEITKGNLTLGTSVTTNNGSLESYAMDTEKPCIKNGADYNPFSEENAKIRDKGTWKNGRAYSAPIWIGLKNGNTIYRFGYSHPEVQDKTQNYVHKNIIPTPLFKGYNLFKTGFYYYSGSNSPFSLW